MRWLRQGLICFRALRGMRMHRWRLIWRESLTMTQILYAAIMGITMEKADADIIADSVTGQRERNLVYKLRYKGAVLQLLYLVWEEALHGIVYSL